MIYAFDYLFYSFRYMKLNFKRLMIGRNYMPIFYFISLLLPISRSIETRIPGVILFVDVFCSHMKSDGFFFLWPVIFARDGVCVPMPFSFRCQNNRWSNKSDAIGTQSIKSTWNWNCVLAVIDSWIPLSDFIFVCIFNNIINNTFITRILPKFFDKFCSRYFTVNLLYIYKDFVYLSLIIF